MSRSSAPHILLIEGDAAAAESIRRSLERHFQADRVTHVSRVDEAAMRARGLANGSADGIKILGTGELTKRLTVSAHGFSASARARIEAMGGSCEVVKPGPAVPEKA